MATIETISVALPADMLELIVRGAACWSAPLPVLFYVVAVALLLSSPIAPLRHWITP